MIIDVDNAFNPIILDSLQLPYSQKITISGDFAYLSQLYYGLSILAISQPENPNW